MKYWKRVNAQGNTTTVESYSHGSNIEGAIEIGEAEFNAYIASLPVVIPPPPRDLAAEIDQLKVIVKALTEHAFSPSFQPPTLEGIAHRVEYIETFLKALCP